MLKTVAASGKISFSGEDTLLPSDNTVASFWITNPDNTYIDNVAAGSDETGFWFSLPMHPQGRVRGLGGRRQHLAAPYAAARIQGQRVPFQLRRVHDSTGTSTKTTPSAWPPSRCCRWQILPIWRAK